ncbi:hypothetical protein AVEN_54103-1 [Araneus ventricosus]|uniref:ZP domain-containing protein n=1 Tax=Araneus ventricosus TaxID=182803 RepID=A0A4Y2BWJ4_ARAVE|nr:hypothetical protein AVEN_54103-1 [Araneus ventricosus]
MQELFRFMVKAAQYLGGIAFHKSIMKQIFLVFMMTVSLSRAIDWENEATLRAVCDNSTMHLSVNFTNAFHGAVYQSRNYFNPKCSYTVPINMNVTEVELPMQFRYCEIKIEELENRTIASTEIIIQMHNLLDSIYDRAVNVSCEIDNFHSDNETKSEDYNPFAAQGLDHSWIEFKNGLVLFGEVGQPTESTLFFVVNVRDDGSNRDMMVQNCVAHTDKNVTNTTTLVQLSNFYGCPDPSAILARFTVVRPENDEATIFAFAPIANFSLIASRGRMSVTCGITICENACPANCNDTESPVQLPLSDYAAKDIVMRNDGVVMPDSLRELNRQNDRSRRTANRPKRSLGSFFSSILRWESQIMTRSVSKRNVTNVTSTGMAKGLLMKNVIFSKDVLVSANKPIDGNLTKIDSNLVQDEFCMDWQTFRFIALMTFCLFITIVACYCCYAEEIQCVVDEGSGALVIRSRLRVRRARGSMPDSTEEPPCMRAWCTLNLTSWIKRPHAGMVR